MAEDLATLNRADLNERAEAAGVEDPEDFPNKEALIEAIYEAEDADTEPGEVPEDEKAEELHTSDPDARVEGVAVGDVEPDAGDAAHASDAPDYEFPPQGDVDVAALSTDELDGETPAPIPPDAKVFLAESDEVPEEYWGHPALVLSIGTNDDDEEEFTVRTRDEHNALLTVSRDAFQEVIAGGVGARGFGP